MPEKETIGGRVPADTMERFEQYRYMHDLNKTDALRRLLEEGLDSEGVGIEQEPEPDSSTSSQSSLTVGDILYENLSTLVKGTIRILTLSVILLWFAASFWNIYQNHGLEFTLLFLGLLAVILVLVESLVDYIKTRSEENPPEVWDGILQILTRSDSDEDAGIDEREKNPADKEVTS